MTGLGRLASIDLDAVREGLEAAVREAGDAILEVRARADMEVRHKPGEGPVTAADYAADAILRRSLVPLIEGARWLSEESREETALLRGEPTWVVDPLDGTQEFVRGLPEYGVSVGLFVDDQLVLGAVGLPPEHSVLSGLVAGTRRESRRDGVPLPTLSDDGAVGRVVVSRNDYEQGRVGYEIPFEVMPLGSAAVKLVHAATVDADIYFSTGPRSVWDVAGGIAVLMGAGGVVLGLNGAALELSPQQIGVAPYVGAAPSVGRALLLRLGLG